MSMKKVELYFKNENDAHSAQAELNKFRVQNVSMEKMEKGNRNGLFIPIFSPFWGTGSGGAGGVFPSITDSDSSTEENKAKEADPKYMSHMLRFEVKEEDYEEAISMLEDYDPYGLETEEK